jgi:hypothetical protein
MFSNRGLDGRLHRCQRHDVDLRLLIRSYGKGVRGRPIGKGIVFMIHERTMETVRSGIQTEPRRRRKSTNRWMDLHTETSRHKPWGSHAQTIMQV